MTTVITAIQQIQQRSTWLTRERLLALAVIGWFAAFGPFACIVHCHLIGHAEHQHATQPFCSSAESGQHGQRPAGLPTIVYDLNTISLVLLILVVMIGTISRWNDVLRSSLILQPPAPPPKW